MKFLTIGFKIFKSVVEYLKRVQSSAALTALVLSQMAWEVGKYCISVSPNSNMDCIYAGTTAGFVETTE